MKNDLVGQPLREVPVLEDRHSGPGQSDLQGKRNISPVQGSEKLAGISAILPLPTDHPRSARLCDQVAKLSFVLPATLIRRLTSLSGQKDCPLYQALLAVFEVLLYRYTNQEKFLIGVPAGERNGPSVINCPRTNILLIEADCSEQPGFLEVLARVHRTIAEESAPLEEIGKIRQQENDSDHVLRVQIMFALQTVDAESPLLSESRMSLEKEDVMLPTGGDLALNLVEAGRDIQGTLTYNAALFEESTMQRLIAHYRTLLEGVIANPRQSVTHLPMLTQAELHQLLIQWNTAGGEDPSQRCMHELFEKQVEHTPDGVAVVYQHEQLTYRELNQRADQLACYLQTCGIGPDCIIGLYVRRSLEMAVGMLAVLKAGGAYLPLDPAYPAERVAYMLQNAQVDIVLTQQRVYSSLPQHPCQVICIDSAWETIASSSHSSAPQASAVTPQNVAYVIYTSGSTGQPKGVQIEHHAIANHSLEVAHAYGLQPGDRVLQFASISFDTAVEELFPPWISGATVVLKVDQQLDTLSAFLDRIEQEQITVLDIPTAYWHEWVAQFPRSSGLLPSALRLVIVGGEAVLSQHLATWQKQIGQRVRWMNAYGPTETTITATLYEPAATHNSLRSPFVPIGRPLANTPVYILDRYMQPVPVGIAGELYIGGKRLARGYLHQPDLTSERFVSNPFSSSADARLYKTGDLVRYQSDGTIDYLGRIDQQVKIRGFRIELGEIEAALIRHPAIKECAVVVREDIRGEKFLVAYVVSQNNLFPGIREMRSYLKNSLPEYMIPAMYMPLERIPLTPNSKIDYRALPAPSQMFPEIVAPRNAVEEILCDIWADVLPVKQVGIRDDFLEIGGQSLLATRIAARIREIFHVEISPLALFEQSTIAELAHLVVAHEKRSGEVEKIARTLTKIKGMSNEDIRKMLENRRKGASV